MQIQENVSLSAYSTMRLGGNGRYLTVVSSRRDIEEAVEWAIEHSVPPLMIGDGSNVIWRDDGFNGLVIINDIKGYEEFAEDELNHYITVGAGENWDDFVAKTVAAGLTGIEALSLIPGRCGATPVQNVGAYGQDVSQTLVTVEAYDLHERQFVTLPAIDCVFGYRTSRFKTTDRDRYLISSLTFHLLKQNPEAPFYRQVADYLNEHPTDVVTPAVLRDAVSAIRRAKLPDPAVVANNGSFFGNPLVDAASAAQLSAQYEDMPQWPDDSGLIKIPAAWLIERAGFKDFHDPATGMGTWPAQPLVLVNEAASSTADLLAFREKIMSSVQEKFGITLEQEPELLP